MSYNPEDPAIFEEDFEYCWINYPDMQEEIRHVKNNGDLSRGSTFSFRRRSPQSGDNGSYMATPRDGTSRDGGSINSAKKELSSLTGSTSRGESLDQRSPRSSQTYNGNFTNGRYSPKKDSSSGGKWKSTRSRFQDSFQTANEPRANTEGGSEDRHQNKYGQDAFARAINDQLTRTGKRRFINKQTYGLIYKFAGDNLEMEKYGNGLELLVEFAVAMQKSDSNIKYKLLKEAEVAYSNEIWKNDFRDLGILTFELILKGMLYTKEGQRMTLD